MFLRLTLLLAAFLPLLAAAHPMDESFVWGNQTVATATGVDPQYGGVVCDLTLSESRYPFVAYATTNPASLRSVKWRNGNKIDEPILTTSGEITAVQVQASGSDIVMVHEVRTYYPANFAWGHTLYYSRLKESAWSTPEPILTSSNGHSFDLDLAPDGTPLVAINCPLYSGYPSSDEVRLYRRQASAWTYELVRPVVDYASVSSVRLAILPDGQPHIAYIEYSPISGGPPNHTRHASRANGVWSYSTILQGNLGAWACGRDGILRVAGAGAYREFRNGSWSSIEQPGDPWATGTSDSLAAAADGTVYLLGLMELRVRRQGVWSTFPTTTHHRVVVDENGIPHLLGAKGSLVRHQTRIPSSWNHSDITVEGSPDARLLGVVAPVNNDPRVYAYHFEDPAGNREYSLANGSWINASVAHQTAQVEYLMQPGGPLHALSGAFHWFGSRTSLTSDPIPVATGGSSSTAIYSLALDSTGNPHATFPAYISGSGNWIYYAVKRNGSWQTSQVASVSSTTHSAVAVDSQEVPHVLTSDGFYKKVGATWQREFQLSNARFTCLVATADGNLHGLYVSGSTLFTFTGKNGDYRIERLDEGIGYPSRPSLALAKGRPIAAWVSTREYPRSYMLNFAEYVGNYWRQETVVPIAENQEYGDEVRIVADPSGQAYLVAPRAYVVNSTIKNRLVLHKRLFTAPATPDRPLKPMVNPARPQEFHLPLPLASLPLEFEVSADLSTWTTLLDLSVYPTLPAAPASIEIRGDGFRNDLIYRAPADARQRFVRIADK